YVNNLAINIPGANGPTLTLTNVTADDAAWRYRVVITNGCGQARSESAALTITTADFNCDGTVSSADFFDYLAAFFAGNPRADLDGDGAVNSADFFAFLTAFFAV